MLNRIPAKITMMQLREQPGEVLRAVEREGRTIVITKNGRDVAKLTPISDVIQVLPDGSVIGERPATFRQNLDDSY